jgi:hypothetical protein
MTRIIGVDAACELVAGHYGHRVIAVTRLIEREGQPYYWIASCGSKGTSLEAPTLAALRESLCIWCFPAAAGAAS